MKKDIHPKYQKVLFVDSASGYKFVCGTTLQPEATEKFEGVEYPVCHLSTSSASHPFFTKEKRFVDAEGRVEKFRKKFERAAAAPAPAPAAPAAAASKPKKPAAKAKKTN
jgi:large subunit ribosomal protein L31